MVSAPATQILYVHPTKGSDRNDGSAQRPYQTLSRALRRAMDGTYIRLAPGRYGLPNGETFPLVVPTGVVVWGDETNRGESIVIEGGGDFLSPIFARQNATVRLGNEALLRGVTITNRNPRGTGVWIESTNPDIAHCTFVNCGREGILTTGDANPAITDSSFLQNAASGLSITRNSKGEVRRNLFQRTGYGVAISDRAAPLLSQNRMLDNRAGIVISGSARPVLRNNQAERNLADGLVVMNNAVPDLGQPEDPGGNLFRRNGESDVRNTSTTPLRSVGNQINPTRVNVNGGRGMQGVEFLASRVNEQIQTVIPRPQPAPPPPPVPPPLPPTPPTEVPSDGSLPDLVGHWAESFVRALVERDIISGYPDGTFRPEVTINRAQYAAMIARAFDLPDRQPTSGFVDVPANFWAAGAIAKTEAMGFIAGFPDGSFRPSLNLTRVQAVVSLVSGLGLTGGHSDALLVYGDRAEIPTYAALPVSVATQKRMVVNYPETDRFEPMIPITRAEIASMIYQALVISGRAQAIASPYIVMPPPVMVSFSDIQDHWAAEFIRGMASQRLVNGFADGRFRPDNSMTRAQYAVLLSNAFNPLPQRAPVNFRDVPSNHWAADAIQRVYRGGLLSGNVDGTFRPDQDVRRVEVLLSLVNGLRLAPGDPALVQRYDDWGAIPSVARPAVASATMHRLVVNYPDLEQLNPMRQATRSEVVAMVYQALVHWGRSPAIASPYIVDPASSPTEPPPPPPDPSAPVVVLDPGHGGEDPGAIGINGLMEKAVNLAIAQQTAAILRQQRLTVVMTRTDDRTLSLTDRVALAEQARASLFVSIHANSAGLDRPQISGIETFHFPNSSEGKTLATLVQDSLIRLNDSPNRGVKTANFFVLRRTSMPSVLVETGFLTGTEDAARLATTAGQASLGRAIALGIIQYAAQPVG